MLKRLFHTLVNRPLKVVSATLGIATGITVVATPDAGGNSVITSISDIVVGLQNQDSAAVAAAAQTIGPRLISSVLSGQWILPASGAIVTGIISRVFKV